MTVRKFLGREGRTTIPYPIRTMLGWKKGDLITFTAQPDGSVLITREYLCDGCEETCCGPDKSEPGVMCEEPITLQDCLDNLSENDQREALVYLSMKWAAKQAGIRR